MLACCGAKRSLLLRPLVRQFATGPVFQYKDVFGVTPDTTTPYKKLTSDFVHVGKDGNIEVEGEGLRLLSERAMIDIAHLLRPAHLQSLSNILKDPEASGNDRFVALELLKNANIASGMVLPGCQDTGTGIVVGKRGLGVKTDGDDEEHLSRGVFDAYTLNNLRYSQMAPLDMYTEKNTGCNLPAQVEEKIKGLGTAACPPYHLAIVIGGLSAEMTLKTVKLASAKYLDGLPTQGSPAGNAFRDLELEAKVLALTQQLGIGAQFGGKYFCHDVRVVRLPRHGASCPVGLGVSCSADRQCKAKITAEGIFVEQLETDVAKYLPEVQESDVSSEVVHVNLNQPMADIRAKLSQYPIRTRLSLSGSMVVARDIAHAKILERLQATGSLPQYLKDHIVYYAGPAKKPEGYASGSFGPTTAGRMDSYVDEFMANGGSFVTLAKGNRSAVVTKACEKHRGFYLGSIGGPAAILAKNCIKKVEVLEFAELGMEAVWKIDVENFPAFVVVDDKGNDFFKKWQV
eukprot:c11939_g1_i2.p1 GENE.c11939_g1_i2~~c11939_g1_i2.p1  ORF type:complete len:537 (+),score=125.17 c11939_g1_i2:69-1613(+)